MALLELAVTNLAVIESVRLPLARGFTAVTGETGAGKSLVVDAVSLVLGARAAADLVRSGAAAARVEAIFDDPDLPPDDPLADALADGEGLAIVRREITAEGRSVARVNDRTVTVGSLAALGARLGEIHGQHDQQRLLDPDRQLALLDRFGGHEALLAAVGDAHRAWRAVVAQGAELITDAHELARRTELLRYQADEISAAALRSGEEVEVEEALRAATHAAVVAAAAADATRALRDDGGALDTLRAALGSLEEAAAHDARFAPLLDRAHALAAEAEELARDAADAGEQVDLDPQSRQGLEERLALIYDLRRKYGATIDEVLAFGEEAAAELARLEDQEGMRDRLRVEEAECHATLESAAAALHDARVAAAASLADGVNAELPPLGLRGGAFDVSLEAAPLGPLGGDRAIFTFAPNPGEPPRPLGRIASGGEASRLSLALKVVLAAADETPLLVFDEVDAGIGGRNGAALGERLKALAAFHQVLCVTHLPQVAAYADAHLVVGKRVEGGRTYTDVRSLAPEERARELAAMLGGATAGSEATAAAEALLRGATR
jgi:DNA repair protein RecN (Recombination protein N)